MHVLRAGMVYIALWYVHVPRSVLMVCTYCTYCTYCTCFCLDFKWFLTRWQPFVPISNTWASRFQIPFKIRIICNPTFFYHSKSRVVGISDPHCMLPMIWPKCKVSTSEYCIMKMSKHGQYNICPYSSHGLLLRCQIIVVFINSSLSVPVCVLVRLSQISRQRLNSENFVKFYFNVTMNLLK